MAQKLPKLAQKLPKMAQKLAPAKKNSRDISPVSPTFCISAFMSFMLDPIVLLRLSSELAMKMEERERLSLRSSMIKVSFVFVF